jgi:ribosomal protein L11 methyltransferase
MSAAPPDQPDPDAELGLWRVSIVVEARALAACEEAIGPAIGAPSRGGGDWVAGIQAISTIPLDPNSEGKPDDLWRLEALCADPPEAGDIHRALAPVVLAFGFETPEVEIEIVRAIDWVKVALASHPPVRAGRFYVHGRHEPALPRSRAIDLKIEAGRAQGIRLERRLRLQEWTTLVLAG